MKFLLIPLFALISPMLLLAQSKKVRIYAFQQKVLPGVLITTIDESGKAQQSPPKTDINYLIYLEAPPSKEVDIRHIWIKGKPFKVKVEKASAPVVMRYTTPKKAADTLVPATPNTIFQITPVHDSDNNAAAALVKRKMKSNQVVVHTIEQGRNCYYYLNKIKNLDPVALQ